jgi:TP901 family phage tail tape measure protein
MADQNLEFIIKATDEASGTINDINKTTQTFSKDMEKSFKTLGVAAAAMSAAVIASLTKMVTTFANVGSELHDMAIKTGFTVETLAGLKYAAEQNSATLGDIQTGVRNVAQAMYDASNGVDSAVKAFGALGIKVEELRGMTPEQQFLKIANAIASIPDPMKRAALAVDILGRSGTNLLPMLSSSTEGLQAMMDKGIALSGWSTDAAKQADDLGDAWGDMKTAMEGLSKSVGEALGTDLKNFMQWLVATIKNFSDWVALHPQVVKGIAMVAVGVGVLAAALGVAAAAMAVFQALSGPAGWVALGIGVAAATAAVISVNKILDEANANADKLATNTSEIESPAITPITAPVSTKTRDTTQPKGSTQNPYTAEEWEWQMDHPGQPLPEKIGDGVVQNGEVISTNPADFLIATKSPASLMEGIGGGSQGDINITVNAGANLMNESTWRKIVRENIQPLISENRRRSFFDPISSGYGAGTSSI